MEQDKNFAGLEPIDYINALLVNKGVRDAYLIQNFESSSENVEKRIQQIQKVFPALKVMKNSNYYFLSPKSLKKEDVDNDSKIARLLRFSCDVDYKDLDRSRETVTYNIFVKVNETPINIITYICQTKSKLRDAEQLVNDIKKVLPNYKVDLDVSVVIPVVSLIPKLINPKYKFNDAEINAVKNIIFNVMNQTSYNKIIDNIDYNNLIHRGIILTYITDHEHDTLSPFYPIQSSGHMEEIFEIEDERSDLMKQILVESKKSMKSKWFGGGNRRTLKKKN